MSKGSAKRLTLYYIAFLVLFLSSCETYRTSFGETYLEPNASEKVFRLDLSNRGLLALPENIDVADLRMLDISGNTELDLSSALRKICAGPNLHILKMNRLQLLALPQELSDCQHLTQLSLTHNPNLDFVKSMALLVELPLAFLDLSYNNLTALPSNLNVLHLRDIRLTGNRLGKAEDFIVLSQIDNLYTVWLDNNEIIKIPPEIGLLSKIGYLYLDNNALSTLPRELSKMSRLGGIWLGYNCFSEIPSTLSDSGILMAYLNNNHISKIGEQFFHGNIKLRGIILDYNYLTEEQTVALKKLFKHMFIYSDHNQLVPSKKLSC
jgi:Leucine-rich repeat (LRR) protein